MFKNNKKSKLTTQVSVNNEDELPPSELIEIDLNQNEPATYYIVGTPTCPFKSNLFLHRKDKEYKKFSKEDYSKLFPNKGEIKLFLTAESAENYAQSICNREVKNNSNKFFAQSSQLIAPVFEVQVEIIEALERGYGSEVSGESAIEENHEMEELSHEKTTDSVDAPQYYKVDAKKYQKQLQIQRAYFPDLTNKIPAINFDDVPNGRLRDHCCII
ncbi:MAG: hypothetical protein Tsb005_16130 [Gammaproteobacteria bacterium]